MWGAGQRSGYKGLRTNSLVRLTGLYELIFFDLICLGSNTNSVTGETFLLKPHRLVGLRVRKASRGDWQEPAND